MSTTHQTKKAIESQDNIKERSIGWNTKKSLRNDIRHHGLADTTQISLSVGTMSLMFPQVSGCFFATGGIGLATGAIVTEIIARNRSNKWEKRFVDKFLNNVSKMTEEKI